MARFYGTTEGVGRTAATRTGHASSPVYSTASGWRIGGAVKAYAPNHVAGNEDKSVDAVAFHLTGGSGHLRESVCLAVFELRGEEIVCTELATASSLRKLGIEVAKPRL